MKFHEYKTLWEEMRTGFPRHVTEEKFYSVAMVGGMRTGRVGSSSSRISYRSTSIRYRVSQ